MAGKHNTVLILMSSGLSQLQVAQYNTRTLTSMHRQYHILTFNWRLLQQNPHLCTAWLAWNIARHLSPSRNISRLIYL